MTSILHRSMTAREEYVTMAQATLLISSKNYSSWSLRGFLLVRLSGLPFDEKVADADDPNNRAELLMQSSSIRVPSLVHGDVTVWDTLAIAEYLNEIYPEAGMWPADQVARARCRSICGEMHSGFAALRGALPMNLRLLCPNDGLAVWRAFTVCWAPAKSVLLTWSLWVWVALGRGPPRRWRGKVGRCASLA